MPEKFDNALENEKEWRRFMTKEILALRKTQIEHGIILSGLKVTVVGISSVFSLAVSAAVTKFFK